jgi:Fe-S oxidoreductase
MVVTLGKATKPYPLPGTGHRTAILGSGLSSLVAAFELAKKGHKAVIHHLGPIGGSLIKLPEEKLPEKVFKETIESLKRLKINFVELDGPLSLAKISDDFKALGFEAVFIGFDDPAIEPKMLGLTESDLAPDPVTMAISRANFFISPVNLVNPHIEATKAGKIAAGSLDRLFQGVNPSSAREKEAITESILNVNLNDRESAPEVSPADPLNPTATDAINEAKRCLACSCLACLPPCPFLQDRVSYPKKLAREFYNNIITAFGNRSSNRFINSCAQCGLCGQICPNGADLGRFVDLCRLDMVATNHMPVSSHEYPLEDQVFSNSPQVAFIRPQKGSQDSKYVLFPGCQLPASLPDVTISLYRHLTSHLDGGVGIWTGCCGAPGRWSGRAILTSKTTEAMLGAHQKLGAPKVILACPSCQLMFKGSLPQIPTIGLWEVLADLPLPKESSARPGSFIIHDPCAARLDETGQDGVRSILKSLKQDYIEPKYTRRFTMCCGYGGLVDQAFPEMGQKFVSQRVMEANAIFKDANGAFIAWCIMCRDRFLASGQRSIHPLELLFDPPKEDDLIAPKPPGISKRRENRLRLRRLMLTELWQEIIPENLQEAPQMNLAIDIPASVLEDFEAKRILVSDVTMVLEHAAKNGPTFVNPESGHSIACLRPRQVTFWVDYELKADGRYLVHRAWCHRMTLPNVPGEGAESPASSEGFARTGGRV